MSFLHESTFDYWQPSPDQVELMMAARRAAKDYAEALDQLVPNGADKTYALRKLRELAMWVNVAITREEDGSPRR